MRTRTIARCKKPWLTLLAAILCLGSSTPKLASQCSTHAGTDGGVKDLGWPAGSKITVSFESGQPGDLTSAQQQQYMAGMQYWTQSGSNDGNLSFSNSGSSSNPNGALNTVFVQVASNMTADNPESTVTIASLGGTSLSAAVSLNINYVNGSLPTPATPAFLSQYLTYVAAHSTGHTLGFDDDYGDDGESVMNVILQDDISQSGQDLGSTYISTSPVKACDLAVLAAQYPPPPPPQPPPPPPPPPPTTPCTPTLGSCVPNLCLAPYCGPLDYFDFDTCRCVYTQSNPSPIVIDIDGTGFHLTSATNGVLFDFFGNGKPIQIAWTAEGSTNGWLALDRNGNGTIDSAEELFGNITAQPPSSSPNGFLALAVFDLPENGGNGDGVIDSRDAIWPKLLVWIDANHDGISQADELHSLDDLGIHSIALDYVKTPFKDEYGNQFRYKGRLNPDRGDKVNRIIYDVFLTYVHPQTAEPNSTENLKPRSHSFASLLENSGAH